MLTAWIKYQSLIESFFACKQCHFRCKRERIHKETHKLGLGRLKCSKKCSHHHHCQEISEQKLDSNQVSPISPSSEMQCYCSPSSCKLLQIPQHCTIVAYIVIYMHWRADWPPKYNIFKMFQIINKIELKIPYLKETPNFSRSLLQSSVDKVGFLSSVAQKFVPKFGY